MFLFRVFVCEGGGGSEVHSQGGLSAGFHCNYKHILQNGLLDLGYPVSLNGERHNSSNNYSLVCHNDPRGSPQCTENSVSLFKNVSARENRAL